MESSLQETLRLVQLVFDKNYRQQDLLANSIDALELSSVLRPLSHKNTLTSIYRHSHQISIFYLNLESDI